MPEPSFAQPERRSYLLPILIAVAALALAAVIATHFFPATTVNIENVHTDVLPTHTVYKADSIVVGQNQTQDVLFIASTLKIDNQLRVPISLDDFTLTFTNSEGAELTERAVQKADLASLELSFPKLTPMIDKPLLRDTQVERGQTGGGTVVFSLPVPLAMWNSRQSAVIKVDIYNHHPVYQTLPKP